MLPDFYINRKRLDYLLVELGKEYRKLSKNPIQIIVVGGAAILTRYSFRIMSLDLDGMFVPNSDALKHAINNVADKNNIPTHWLNDDFKYTESFSKSIYLYSDYYKTFSNLIEVRLVKPSYLIAMKLVSSRIYRNDLSDVIGIILEERNNNNPIKKSDIIESLSNLYGGNYEKKMSLESKQMLDEIYNEESELEQMFVTIKENEVNNATTLSNIKKNNPTMKIDELIERIKSQKQ